MISTRTTAPPADALILALDTGSPQVSVAVGRRGGELLAERSIEMARSSARLLELVGEALAEIGAGPRDLGGVAVLRGPGSFTGLRIGLATALGLHQSLGIPAAALPTLSALALHAAMPGEIVAVVDALRGEWSAQAFSAGAPLAAPELVPGPELPRLFPAGEPRTVAGFGVSRLAELAGWPPEIRLLEAGPLAAAALRLAAAPEAAWDAGLLVSPIYSRAPAVTPMRPRGAAVGMT